MKAKVVIELPTGEPLQALLAFVATQPILHMSVDIAVPKPTYARPPLLRDKVMNSIMVVQGERGPRDPNRPPAKSLVLEAIEKTAGPVRTADLAAMVASYGHQRNAAHTALNGLLADGKVKRLGPALYGRPDAELPPRGMRRSNLGRQLIDQTFADGAVHSRHALQELFVKAGLARKSVDSRIAEAVNEGQLTRVGQAVYRLATVTGKDDDGSPAA